MSVVNCLGDVDVLLFCEGYRDIACYVSKFMEEFSSYILSLLPVRTLKLFFIYEYPILNSIYLFFNSIFGIGYFIGKC